MEQLLVFNNSRSPQKRDLDKSPPPPRKLPPFRTPPPPLPPVPSHQNFRRPPWGGCKFFLELRNCSLLVARNFGQACALETAFLRYIVSQNASMFIGFIGRIDIKSILPQ